MADDGEEERRRGSGGGGEGAGGESCLGHRVPTKGFFAFSPPPPFCRMLRLRRDVVPDDDESARERPRVRIPGAELRREQRRRPRGGGLARGLTGKKERKKEKNLDKTNENLNTFFQNSNPSFPSFQSMHFVLDASRTWSRPCSFSALFLVWKEERKRGRREGKKERTNFFSAFFLSPLSLSLSLSLSLALPTRPTHFCLVLLALKLRPVC